MKRDECNSCKCFTCHKNGDECGGCENCGMCYNKYPVQECKSYQRELKFDDILQALPHNEPEWECGNARDKYWSSGDEILCRNEIEANIIGDFLTSMGFEYVNTGYYDPYEDAMNGETDRFSGWCWVTVG